VGVLVGKGELGAVKTYNENMKSMREEAKKQKANAGAGPPQ
jgi:hypothetical protein